VGGAADHERIVARMVTRCQGRAKTHHHQADRERPRASSPAICDVHPGKFTLGSPLCPHSAEPESGTNARQPADEPRGAGLTRGPEIVSEII